VIGQSHVPPGHIEEVRSTSYACQTPQTARAAMPARWNRDTGRYSLRRLVPRTACAAALQGQDYKREVPESAARAIRRGAA
jgi:hypothetical protein